MIYQEQQFHAKSITAIAQEECTDEDVRGLVTLDDHYLLAKKSEPAVP